MDKLDELFEDAVQYALTTPKRCSACKENKPLVEFYFSKPRNTWDHICKACRRKDSSNWYHNGNEARVKQRQYLRRHGTNITPEEAAELVTNRVRACEVCGNVEPVVIDHNHVTGARRGFLCNKCNSVLGYVEDSVERLAAMIVYLEKYGA